MNRHQLNRGHSKILQVRDLLNDPEVGSAVLCADSRVRVVREPFDVEFVDHEVVGVANRLVFAPIESVETFQYPKRGLAIVAPRSASCRPVVPGGEKNKFRIWVKENLVAVEGMPLHLRSR